MRRLSAFLLIAALLAALTLCACGGAGGDPSDTLPPVSISLPDGDGQDGDECPEGAFIINVSSRSFHVPDCAHAKKISEDNRRISTESAEALIGEGYKPCGHCIKSSEPTSSDAVSEPSASVPDSDASSAVPESTGAEDEPQGVHYVLNTSTKKIHKPDCRYADNKNREDYYGDADELLEEGYTFCKVCHKD